MADLPHLPELMRHGLLALSLLALVLGMGCAQYRADLRQQFMENGSSRLEGQERFALRIDELSGYATWIHEANASEDGQRLAGEILRYYNNGSYANALCRRVEYGDYCRVDENGTLNWKTTLNPDGRFYTVSSSTDWFNLYQTKTYEISRLPLIHYQVYRQQAPEEIARAEWTDLRGTLEIRLRESAGGNSSGESDTTRALLQADSPLAVAVREYAPVRTVQRIVDFETNRIRDRPMTLPSLAELSGESMGVRSQMSYVAEFPDPILSATMNGEALPIEEGVRIHVGLDEREAPAGGRIVVVTRRDYSPLGPWTWAIPILGVTLTVMRDFLFGDKAIWKDEEDGPK